MKPRYQLRKKIVQGITKPRRRWTSSWNSGDRSIASQSTAVGVRSSCSVMSSPPTETVIDGESYPPGHRSLCRIAQGSGGSTSGVSGTTNGARSAGRARILAAKEGAALDVVLGVLLGMVLAASLAAGWRLVSAPRRVLDPGGAA